MAQSENNFKNGAQATTWSGDEFERVPLKQRLKLLLSNYRSGSDLNLETHISSIPRSLGVSVAEKWENGHWDSQNGCYAEECMTETVRKEERHAGELGECDNQENIPNTCASSTHTVAAAAISDKFDSVGSSSLHESLFVKNPVTVKAEYADNLVESSSTSCTSVSSVAGVQAAVESEMIIEYLDELEHVVLKERLRMLLASKCLGLTSTMSKGSAIPSLAIPPGYDKLQGTNVAAPDQMSFGDFVLVKSEVQTTDDAYGDVLDHMLLRDRMKLLSPRDGPSLDIHQSSKCMSKTVPSAFGCKPVGSTPAPSFKVNRPRKRRRTVTDSIETAMEEDAPGLLKVLIDKGVLVDEIKLYGELESNEALEDSSTTNNFAELEEVITKLFSQRDSLLKLAPLRCTKGEKASYCLECLLSLVEQARYLRFRKWPVEWGWCRDLQSFIFVFERHNRLVLERPEYGYATYFFELADSLPIYWQIKRLIIAMKLTNCSRISILENKALMVDDDLSEGEARVLMEYGWIPNTGLGTMLNYRDRVVHDRRNENDRSDWKSKIGKLLMDGYNGGTIVSAGIPRRVVESDVAHPVEIKLELN
ncbi:hypothetical protein PHJA_001409100 [Phtheirospermum japonicum]|uniref:Uncharacterized protein n=1 Tax=Phtheirospermum japonicum TaxID=374723 RepID=A0A830C0X7_9LAMI|nr:hypothetical protein PHJA_001409100 [Phtheirospermum japonicum]